MKKICEISEIDTFESERSVHFEGSNRIRSEMEMHSLYLLFATGKILWFQFTNDKEFVHHADITYSQIINNQIHVESDGIWFPREIRTFHYPILLSASATFDANLQETG